MSTPVAVVIIVTAVASVTLWAIALRSVLRVLDYVVSQFKTDSGTSLRDAVERLERSAERSEAAAKVIAENLVISKGIVEGVAEDLVIAKVAVAGVAANLADSQVRADEVIEGQPGEAADAGAQSPKVDP